MWKDVPGFDNYQVSRSGIVRNKKKKKEVKPFLNNNGYLRVNLIKNDGTRVKMLVHVIVAMTYIENSNNLNEVNHKNNKRYDNRVLNLEWINHSDNCKQIYKKEKKEKKRKEKIVMK